MITSSKTNSLYGNIILPGDKSISHRAIIVGTLSIGKTVIEGLLESELSLAEQKIEKDESFF